MPEGEAPLGLRDMTEDDLQDGLRLSRASGWNQTLEDWGQLLRLGPDLFRVAVERGRVVATGGAVRYDGGLAWICMILVDPGRRGRGLGTRIFDEVLERVRARVGERAAVGLDATPAGLAIYAARGFLREADLLRMSVAPGPAGPASPEVRSLEPGELEAVLALDRRVFGADRSEVLRRTAASAPDLARVVREGHRVRGYCLGRHGDHSDHVGPVVAEDASAARELVAACRAHGRGRPLLLDARAEPGWLATLGDLGFAPQRPLTRMYLGSPRPAAEPALEPAVLGPEFG